MGRGESKLKRHERYLGQKDKTKSKIKIDNPAGIPSNAITLDEFYVLMGVSYALSGAGIDRYAGANMTRMSEKQRKKTLKEIDKENEAYYNRREEVRAEYERLIKKGEIRDKTSIERRSAGRSVANP